MAATKQPLVQNEMHGVYTAGNPTDRPRGTASTCVDFRVMPGYWLRLRGGKKAQYLIPLGGQAQQIHEFRSPGYTGAASHLIQIKYGSVPKWTWVTLGSYIVDPNGLQTIATANDSSWSVSNPAAACNLYDRPMFYNGLGVRGASSSTPPFSTYYNGALRYMGMDAYCPSGSRPTVALAEGVGDNTITTRVKIFAGLYNSSTAHYSNAVYCGEVTGGETAPITGTITVSNLDRLKPAYLNSTEQGELYYVFYATFDGDAYSVPYLILDSSYTGPHKVAISSSSASLSLASAFDNGYATDLTKEAPYLNHPPRPMRSVAFVNGRVYGVPMTGGSGGAVGMPAVFDTAQVRNDFTYQPSAADQAGVVWSNSYSDNYSQLHPGDPLQCWPVTNYIGTPTGDTPIVVKPSQDGQRVFVGTTRSAYYLTEAADGLHEWFALSEIHGITNPMTFVQTRYGQAWINQYNQLVMLPFGATDVVVLSDNYQSLIVGTVRQCDYIYDPLNHIDRIEIFLSGGTSVCHDFAIGGESYTSTNRDYTAAKAVIDTSGAVHHILAKTAIYKHEKQPSTGNIPSQDEDYKVVTDGAIAATSKKLTSATAAFVAGDQGKAINIAGAGTAGVYLSTTIASVTSGTQVTLAAPAVLTVSGARVEFARIVTTDPTGEYHRNWDDFGDSTARKELSGVGLIADAESSVVLGGYPIQVEAYYDFAEVATANKNSGTVLKTQQSPTDSRFEAILPNANAFWYKFVYRLRGHGADAAAFLTHIQPGTQGDLAKNFYGAILRTLYQIKQTVNRT